ncbi:MAG: ChbG/HpnK family deacetylase [Azospirillaceae bacterium]|nr:ChbG/HpnK family deacetylase [Azospirillaceae bacterium]
MKPRSAITPVVLCADDYALSPGVSEAIRRLIARGRLSATSCMVTTSEWPVEAVALRPFAGCADIGLHLTLTDQAPLTPMPRLAPTGRLPSVGSLIVTALRGRLNPAEIEAEVAGQVESFTTAFGVPPAFIDGHQHIQQLPVIRTAVLRQLARLPGAYVRCGVEPAGSIVRRGIATAKSLLIAGLGLALRREARRAGIPANTRFRGIYDFSGRDPYAALFERFVSAPGQRTLIMCHPGFADPVLAQRDSVTGQRETEFAFLDGPQLPDILARQGVRLARFAALPGANPPTA